MIFRVKRGLDKSKSRTVNNILKSRFRFWIAGECDFETNLCTWYNARTGDNFDWIIGSGSTPSYFTGPTADRNGDRNGKCYIVQYMKYLKDDKIWLVILLNSPPCTLIPKKFGRLNFGRWIFGPKIWISDNIRLKFRAN